VSNPGKVKPAIDFLLKRNLLFCASTLASISCSLARRNLVLVRFDGVDVLYRWPKGAICLEGYTKRPWSMVSASIDVFCYEYHPLIGDTVLDIGAGCGTEIAFYSKAVGDSGRVFAIEADPNVYRRLQKTVKLLRVKNVVTLNAAVFSTSKNVWVNVVTSAGIGNFVSEEYRAGAIEIRGYSFDDLIKFLGLDEIDYVKLNIEGAEGDALMGLNVFNQLVKHWCISCHDFLGVDFLTFDFVNHWLKVNNYKVRYFPQSTEAYKNFYIYANNN
jgi:FkbM family methyltransferase